MEQQLGPLQRKWLEFLKANSHKQGRGQLGRKSNDTTKMCCLGAAGILLGTCKWEEGELVETSSQSLNYLNDSHKELGLYNNTGLIKYLDTPSPWEPTSLAEMNDDGLDSLTWYEMACMMEAAPELFFSKPL
jgi:hypothetical protein